MRFIRDIYSEARAAGRPAISFEFFTPKTDEGEQRFFEQVMPALAALRPDYCSVTYGAGGSTQSRTFSMVDRIQREFGIPCMAHLTCVGATREAIRTLLRDARERGIRNILALRGDPPEGADGFTPVEGGFRYAAELVDVIRELGDFGIGVAGFPEGHLENREGRLADWGHLRAKIERGADFVLTQIFFDNRFFHEFRAHLNGALQVRVPLVPGIIPIMSAGQIERFTALCGATIPAALARRLEALKDDNAAAAAFGVEFATEQCVDLLRAGVPGLHFYTLNKVASTQAILAKLGLS
ncbi:MAG: methylenetetrahydrofolate reductase [NAD(P)H] [Verrucomicrobiae bacterium]|nr:methylenetetrahydrofolate reductase [NAD(P)H] [Verrucomicrobiae bacterium]